jgi:hypothetical protein
MSRAGTLRSVVTTFARRGTTGLPDGSDVVGDDVGSTFVVGESVLGPTGAGVCPMIGLPVGNPAGSAVVGPIEGACARLGETIPKEMKIPKKMF